MAGIALKEIVDSLGGELIGDPQFKVFRIAPFDQAGPTDIAFWRDHSYPSVADRSKLGCSIVVPSCRAEASLRGNCILTGDPYLYYARLSQLWRQKFGRPWASPGLHPSAVIDGSARVHPTASIGPLCVVGANATIGQHTVLVARVFVGDDCTVGARCLLHPGVVIGADGFGFAPDRHNGYTRWEKIEQLATVVVGDDVEIGANTCVDRGALKNTVLADGVKLDNLIQVGHAVEMGRNTAVAACVAIAGSTKIGSGCTIGGGSSVAGHLSIAGNVHISGATTVTKSLPKPGRYTGVFPLDSHDNWEKNAASVKQLNRLRERIKVIEAKLNKVDAQ